MKKLIVILLTSFTVFAEPNAFRDVKFGDLLDNGLSKNDISDVRNKMTQYGFRRGKTDETTAAFNNKKGVVVHFTYDQKLGIHRSFLQISNKIFAVDKFKNKIESDNNVKLEPTTHNIDISLKIFNGRLPVANIGMVNVDLKCYKYSDDNYSFMIIDTKEPPKINKLSNPEKTGKDETNVFNDFKRNYEEKTQATYQYGVPFQQYFVKFEPLNDSYVQIQSNKIEKAILEYKNAQNKLEEEQEQQKNSKEQEDALNF